MTLPSVFPEMKAVNPAVLSLRKAGSLRATAQLDNIKKIQRITSLDATPFIVNESSKIDLINANLFRSGRGGGITTEFSADYTTGEKETTLKDATTNTSSFVTKASSGYVNFAVGIPQKMGVAVTYVDYKSSYTINELVNGTRYNSSASNKTTITGIKPGIILGTSAASLGLHFEYDKLKHSDIGSRAPNSQKIIGAALGIGSPNFLLEFGVEIDPFTKVETDPVLQIEESPTPMKLSLLAETKIYKLTLGYKGMAFKGPYTDLDRIIQNQLVFGNMGQKTRLEHVVNFSLGSSSGMTYGASGSYSKTNTLEKSNIFISNNKHNTETKAMSVSVKIGHNF